MQQLSEQSRKHPRKEFNRSLGMLVHGQYFVFKSIEISEGGISIASDVVFKSGDDCVINFQIPNGNFVSVRSKVRHTSKNGTYMQVGISFENLEFSCKRQIRSFVAVR